MNASNSSDSKENTGINDIKVSLKRTKETISNVKLKQKHAYIMKQASLITDDYSYGNNGSMNVNNIESHKVKGSYVIYCSPVGNNDSGLKRAAKMAQFKQAMGMLGFDIMKTGNVSMFHNDFNKDGIIISRTVSSEYDYNEMINDLQNAVNMYDSNDDGFLVYRNENDRKANDEIIIADSTANDIMSYIKITGIKADMNGYEYYDDFNNPKTVIPVYDNDNYSFMKNICDISIIRTNILTIRKEMK